MKKILILALVFSLLMGVVITATACDKADPKSAYDLAVENGFDGSVEDWLNSLKGAPGETGATGATGETGATGATGETGSPGKSAYDLATEAGFEGTAEDWLNSLSIQSAKISLSNEGKWMFGNLDSGLNINNTTNIVFKQQEESLSGNLIIDVDFFGSFEKVKYSVFREGLAIDEIEYVDYIVEDEILSQGLVMEDIVAPYFGNYQIDLDFYDKDEIIYTHNINGINFKASHYNFVYSNSTMPVLYSAAEVVSLDHSSPTYIAINRASTFDWGRLPENCYALPNSEFTTSTTKLALFDEDGNEKTTTYQALKNGSWGAIYANSSQVTIALKQMKHWIGDLYSMNNSSTFTFYVDDTISNVALWFTYGNNLPFENFEIVMFTEGSSTASWIPKYQLQAYSKWLTARTQYLSYVESLKNGLEIGTIWQAKWSFVMNADTNITHVVNTKTSLLNQLDVSAENYEEYRGIMASNLTQFTISDALEKVEDADKTKDLEFLLRTRWIDSDNEEGSAGIYFSGDTGKKSLMIIGTSPAGENNSNGCGLDTTLMSFMEYLVDTYGIEYDIFYKGHPSYPINRFDDGRVEYFSDNDIIVLPNAVPAETYMYLYEDVYIGGYYSSTMISSMVDQTVFFFGTEERITAQAAIAPLFDKTDPDYLGVFENTVFITFDSIQ